MKGLLLFSLIICTLGLSAQNSVLSSGDWHQFSISEDGVYRLDYQTLIELGVLNGPTMSSELAMFSNGPGMLPEKNWIDRPTDLLEIPIQVIDGGDDEFGPGDYLLFYGADQTTWEYLNEENRFVHKSNIYTDETNYFFTTDHGSEKRIVPHTSQLYQVSAETNSFVDYTVHEQELINLISSGKKWFGEDFTEQDTYSFDFHFPNLIAEEDGLCVVDVVSRSTGTGNSNSFHVSAPNNNESFDVINVSSNYLNDMVRATQHQMTFSSFSDAIPINVSFEPIDIYSLGWLNFITVQVQRELTVLEGEQLHFQYPFEVGTNGSTEYTVSNYSENLKIWDITEFHELYEVMGSAENSEFTFYGNNNVLRSYVCFDPNEALSPEFHGSVPNQNLKGQPFADGFIITHPEFLAAAQQLANFHETNSGLSVNVATTTEVYNEFSGGHVDITAIKDYMRYFYNSAEDEESKPQYLCLFGDASYDYKGHIYPNSSYVPTFQSEKSFALITSYCSDDYFGLLEDNESNELSHTLDLKIGRLPAKNAQEAQVMVDKIIGYKNPESLGQWQYNVMFVADDEDNNIHMSQSNQLANNMEGTRCAIQTHKVFFDAFEQVDNGNGDRYPEATAAILNQIEQGVLICNYTGHSGHSNWSAELVLLDTMINQLTNAPRLPLFFMANCEYSKFDSPQFVSGSELMLLNPNGGAIAAISNSRVGYSSANYVFNNHFNSQVFAQQDDQYLRLGDLIKYAKNESISNNVMSHRTINLLGDPMLRLNIPELEISVDNLTGNVDSIDGQNMLQFASEIELSGEVHRSNGSLAADFSGDLSYLILDSKTPEITLGNDDFPPFTYQLQNDTVAFGNAVVVNGIYSFSANIENNGNGYMGNGKILLFAKNAEVSAVGCYTDFNVLQSPLATENKIPLNATLYPNPVKDLLIVEPNVMYEKITWRLYNLNGKVMARDTHYQGTRIEIPVSELSSGSYFLKLESEKQIAVIKVIKTQ